MAELRLAGQIAGAEGQRVTLSLTYKTDWRDSTKGLPLPIYLFESFDGGLSWHTFGGGLPKLLGAGDGSEVAPTVSGVYTVFRSGLPPFARGVERHVYANTDTAGVFDFTLPDTLAGKPVSTSQAPAQVQMLPGQGERGERGASILIGASAPSDGLGIAGDGYIDTSTFDFWERLAGQWQIVGNIKGGQGGRGPEGPKGVNGKSFPVPSAAQLNFIPVADGSQPNGFSWYDASRVAGKSRFFDLLDVERTAFTAGGTYALKYNANTRKLEGVDVSTLGSGNTGGNTDASAADFLALTAPKFISENPRQLLYGDIKNGDAFYFPPMAKDNEGINSVLRIKPKSDYLYIYSSGSFYFGAVGDYLPYTPLENNGLYNGGGSIKMYSNLTPNKEYVIWPADTNEAVIMAFNFDSAIASSGIAGGLKYPDFSETVMLGPDESTPAFSNQTEELGEFVFKRGIPEQAGAGFLASVRSFGNLRLQLHETSGYAANSGTLIQEVIPPSDDAFHTVQFRFPHDGYFVLYAIGRGQIISPMWLNPGVRQGNPFRGEMATIRTTNLAEIPPLSSGIYLTPDNAPRMVYKDESGQVFYAPPMTTTP